eukprot:2743440-Lingulodinium_polyedra.AAC.1
MSWNAAYMYKKTIVHNRIRLRCCFSAAWMLLKMLRGNCSGGASVMIGWCLGDAWVLIGCCLGAAWVLRGCYLGAC